MTESSNERYGRLQKFIMAVSAISWIAIVVGIALLMRFWLPDIDLKADLAAIEDATTEQMPFDRPLPAALRPLSGALPAAAASGSIYLPLYSDLYVGGQRGLKRLSSTLTLRNISADRSVIVTALTYFDESGKAVSAPLDNPHELAPMSTAKLYVDGSDTNGAIVSAAVIEWSMPDGGEAPPLLVQAVTVGNYGTKVVSFMTDGVARP